MLDTLNDIDTALFLALNGAIVMWWVSKPLFWCNSIPMRMVDDNCLLCARACA